MGSSFPHKIGRTVTIATIVVLALLLFRNIGGGGGGNGHAVPEAFQVDGPTGRSMAQATAAAVASGKPVLAFATASWCGPCQRLKESTLTDPRVIEWIRAETEPAYIDVDEREQDATRLNVSSVPTLVVLRAGREVARISGVLSPNEFLDWGKAVLREPVERNDGRRGVGIVP